MNETHLLIGPHEGRELELMLKGEKPAAMFYWIKDREEHIFENVIAAFQPHVDNGTLLKKEYIQPFETHSLQYAFYALPQHVENLNRLMEITDYLHNPKRTGSWSKELDREVGELLGYPAMAIEFFINRPKSAA